MNLIPFEFPRHKNCDSNILKMHIGKGAFLSFYFDFDHQIAEFA